MHILHLRKVSLIKYTRYKNIQMKREESFYKKFACLHIIKKSIPEKWDPGPMRGIRDPETSTRDLHRGPGTQHP